jgi:hypothetical protein
VTGLRGVCARGSKYKQTDISGAVHGLFIGGSGKMACALTLVAEKAATGRQAGSLLGGLGLAVGAGGGQLGQ